ncbi:hypothetical protein V2I29_03055 [Campylobacter sp. CX2-8023-23]|uniref:hypothetical protein n=1 Tax=Campylobacter porcelli TaxID=1660073 RepID=UPI002E9D2A80|nr:hypothetical protein [Campylobacter sp. CX2-8023-23]
MWAFLGVIAIVAALLTGPIGWIILGILLITYQAIKNEEKQKTTDTKSTQSNQTKNELNAQTEQIIKAMQESNNKQHREAAKTILNFVNQSKIQINKKELIEYFEDYILYKTSRAVSNLTDIDKSTKTKLEENLYECFVSDLDSYINDEMRDSNDFTNAKLKEIQIRAIFYALLKTAETYFDNKRFTQEVYHQYDDEIIELANSDNLNDEKLVAKSLQLFNPAILLLQHPEQISNTSEQEYSDYEDELYDIFNKKS